MNGAAHKYFNMCPLPIIELANNYRADQNNSLEVQRKGNK